MSTLYFRVVAIIVATVLGLGFVHSQFVVAHPLFSHQSAILLFSLLVYLMFSPSARKISAWSVFAGLAIGYVVLSFVPLPGYEMTIAQWVDASVFAETTAHSSVASRVGIGLLFLSGLIADFGGTVAITVARLLTIPAVLAVASVNYLSSFDDSPLIDRFMSPPTSFALVMLSVLAMAKASQRLPFRHLYRFWETATYDWFNQVAVFVVPFGLHFAVTVATGEGPNPIFFPLISLTMYGFYLTSTLFNLRVARIRSGLEMRERQISRGAGHDLLSGALNRSGMQQALDSIDGRFAGVLVLDIDRFKHINDRWGHFVGDRVIRCVARLIHQNIRPTDLCARWGGEEFVVVVDSECGPQDPQAVAERIRRACDEYSELGLPSFTVSIGIAQRTGENDCFVDLAEAADRDLYQAKRSRSANMAATPAGHSW